MAERAAFARDGVTVARGLVPPAWIERLRDAVPALLPATTAPKFHNVADVHRRDDAVRAFTVAGPVAAAAGALLQAQQVTLYADVLLVKDARATERTPWHHDLPFWPFRGRALTAWCALDSVDDGNGALEYVAGSHRWGRWFRPPGVPVQPLPGGGAEEMPADPTGGTPPLRFTLAPGDVLFHHPLVVHGAGGNGSAAWRRALSLRLVGDDARWTGQALFGAPPTTLRPGDPLDRDPRYPVVWRRDGATVTSRQSISDMPETRST